ncbi:HAD family hydrolase [Nocardia wallacei]|uniref:HAD family hydrolase n=1 Tax=Nocardia wallacei TaxID=480035 RepID=UPI00245433A4|nr:HAD-IA family hydrolase [Nocardia wallacei]
MTADEASRPRTPHRAEDFGDGLSCGCTTGGYGVLLDFDGLVLDSEGTALSVLRAMFEERATMLPEALPHLMNGVLAFARSSLTMVAADDPVEALLDEFEQRCVERCGELAAMDGITNLLDTVSEHGDTVAVVTNNEAGWVMDQLTRLGLRGKVVALVTRDGDPGCRAKPSPDLYRKAAARAGLPDGRLIAVEDSPTGVAAATAAGLACVAVRNPAFRGLPFDAADLVVDSALLLDSCTLRKVLSVRAEQGWA